MKKINILAPFINVGDIIQPAGNSVIVRSVRRHGDDIHLTVWTIGSQREDKFVLRENDLITLVIDHIECSPD